MKLQSLFSASVLAVFFALSSGVQAADQEPAGAAAADTKAAKPMKPHSHMQEKVGVAPNAPAKDAAAPAEKKDVTKNKARHLGSSYAKVDSL